ncbi:hypothetical protein PTTG_29220 [Puccinia triticina 1-1 BBBD Race 1]|uniref:Uncharacterized protein n=1 Tax=Puccinia triticina (isolate 1-1 / race 1 (BBBD)) TaxID=630390 RepID=A0A180G5Q2_PUCT1|nr:hypothetical protein PTTG_29220 [Puccinia triticina 1-1 BBBD Race 1]
MSISPGQTHLIEDIPAAQHSQSADWFDENYLNAHSLTPATSAHTTSAFQDSFPSFDLQGHQERPRWHFPFNGFFRQNDRFRQHELLSAASDHDFIDIGDVVPENLIPNDDTPSDIPLNAKRKANDLQSNLNEISPTRKPFKKSPDHNELLKTNGDAQGRARDLALAENPQYEISYLASRPFSKMKLRYLGELLTAERSRRVLDDTEISGLEYLHADDHWSGAPPGHSFWIPSEKVDEFLQNDTIAERPLRFATGEVREVKHELAVIFLILSHQRLDITQYTIFSDQIMNFFQGKINWWRNHAHESTVPFDTRLHAKSEKRILEYVKNVTKISTFLIITYMYLHKQPGGGAVEMVSKEDVQNVLIFMKNLWEQDKEIPSLERKEYIYIKRMTDITCPNTPENKCWFRGQPLYYHTSEAVFRYWREQNLGKLTRRGKRKGIELELTQMLELILVTSTVDSEYTRIFIKDKYEIGKLQHFLLPPKRSSQSQGPKKANSQPHSSNLEQLLKN